MPTPTRVYCVTVGDQRRLVRAAHPATATAHVARDLLKVRVATQDDLLDAFRDGIQVETIRNEQTPLET